ncbi:MAG: hypothetical protein K5682_06990 [Lachnospiraceae bacterium]|nr:hypothetical protein [Lachnospiraceae bacterium]
MKRVPKEYYEVISGGKLEEFTYEATLYGGDQSRVTKRALAYLPKGYDNSDARYPVLFLMHGGGGDEEEFFYCQSRSLELVHILDHMIENGDVEPLIVITPTFYYKEDREKLHEMGELGNLTKIYHKEFRNDLLPVVDRKFRTIADRDHRGFGGFSMSSETTWEMYLNALDLVRNYMPMSGDCWIITEKGGENFAEKTSQRMKEQLKKNGFDDLSYNVYAYTGDKDIAFPALDPLIKAMLADGFDNGQDKRLRYGSWSEGTHCYEHGYEYIYNLLAEVMN